MLRIFGQRFIRSITVAVSDLNEMESTQTALTDLLKDRHRGNLDFQIRNMADLLETATTAQDTLTISWVRWRRSRCSSAASAS
jgi:macrolide transport system ATP-binding/permease protein